MHGVSVVLKFGQYLRLKASPYSLGWRYGSLKVKALASRSTPWPGSLNFVLMQDTLLSQCLSPPVCIYG